MTVIKKKMGTSLVVQRLRLWVPTERGTGSIPGRGTKIPHAHAVRPQKKREKDTSVGKDAEKSEHLCTVELMGM